ncbi:hypothetical protein BJY04DRAFT_15955 [Aspergillus karnatakaensis]|uniref:uncharacterized protein n=1 Tax=Aspergillus karnatakaensis TaxID=1810916 RepID=UPI003CCCD133
MQVSQIPRNGSLTCISSRGPKQSSWHGSTFGGLHAAGAEASVVSNRNKPETNGKDQREWTTFDGTLCYLNLRLKFSLQLMGSIVWQSPSRGILMRRTRLTNLALRGSERKKKSAKIKADTTFIDAGKQAGYESSLNYGCKGSSSPSILPGRVEVGLQQWRLP